MPNGNGGNGRTARGLTKISGKAMTDLERQEAAQRLRERAMREITGKALTEEEMDKLLRRSWR